MGAFCTRHLSLRYVALCHGSEDRPCHRHLYRNCRGRVVARRAGVDRRAGSGTTSTAALIMELTEQECRAALLILAHARTSLACGVGSTVEDATVVRCRCRGAAR